MSQQRRENQQKKQPKSNRRFVVAAIVLFVAVATGSSWWRQHRQGNKYDAFAKCLTQKNVRMYGLETCTHCLEQKELFGASFQYVNYTECLIPGARQLQPECQAAGVKRFPTWQFSDGSRNEGTMPLQAIADKTGCTLP